MCNVIRRHHCTFEKIRPHQLYWPTCCRLGRCQVHFAWQSFYYASHLPLFRWKSSVLKRINYTLYDTKFLQSQVLTRLSLICDSALFYVWRGRRSTTSKYAMIQMMDDWYYMLMTQQIQHRDIVVQHIIFYSCNRYFKSSFVSDIYLCILMDKESSNKLGRIYWIITKSHFI